MVGDLMQPSRSGRGLPRDPSHRNAQLRRGSAGEGRDLAGRNSTASSNLKWGGIQGFKGGDLLTKPSVSSG